MFNAKSNNKSTYNKVKHLEQIHCLIDHIQQSPPTILRNYAYINFQIRKAMTISINKSMTSF